MDGIDWGKLSTGFRSTELIGKTVYRIQIGRIDWGKLSTVF